MKIKTLFFSMALLACSLAVNAQDNFTTTGSCASYIQIHNSDYLGADSIYTIVKTTSPIVVDAVAEGAWNNAVPAPITHLASYPGAAWDLSTLPQTEAYAYAVYKALWTDEGVYTFISVKDNAVRYQDPASPWQNDAIEFYFARARTEGFKQVVIPAMVGTTDGSKYPVAKDYESGSAVGSQPDYKVYNYDDKNWDSETFNWAIKKTADGWDLETYMDKGIVTNLNDETNYGLGKTFAGDINLDIAGEKVNANSPALYVREATLSLLGYSNQEYAGSSNYGYFTFVDAPNGVNSPKDSKFKAIYNADNKIINITSSTLVSSVEVFNVAGQVMPTNYNNASVSVSNLKQGIYILKAKDVAGNSLGVQKVVIY